MLAPMTLELHSGSPPALVSSASIAGQRSARSLSPLRARDGVLVSELLVLAAAGALAFRIHDALFVVSGAASGSPPHYPRSEYTRVLPLRPR
jgi:hypothetical protein